MLLQADSRISHLEMELPQSLSLLDDKIGKVNLN